LPQKLSRRWRWSWQSSCRAGLGHPRNLRGGGGRPGRAHRESATAAFVAEVGQGDGCCRRFRLRASEISRRDGFGEGSDCAELRYCAVRTMACRPPTSMAVIIIFATVFARWSGTESGRFLYYAVGMVRALAIRLRCIPFGYSTTWLLQCLLRSGIVEVYKPARLKVITHGRGESERVKEFPTAHDCAPP